MSNELEMFRQAGEAMASSSPEAKKVLVLAQECYVLARNIEQATALLEGLNSRWNQIKQTDLPEAMAKMGSGVWASPDEAKSVSIEIKDFVAGSLPKPDPKLEYDPEGIARRKKALDWLRDHDGEAIIKTEITLTFGKGEDNVALDLAETLREKGFEPNVESGVHPQTLQKYARERLKKGENVDFDTLGLMSARYADVKVTLPPKKPEEPDNGN